LQLLGRSIQDIDTRHAFDAFNPGFDDVLYLLRIVRQLAGSTG
jgi:hypothetical protein